MTEENRYEEIDFGLVEPGKIYKKTLHISNVRLKSINENFALTKFIFKPNKDSISKLG